MKLLFSFDEIGPTGGATAKARAAFTRAGAKPVQVDASATLRGPGGVQFKELSFVFADGQTVTLRIKSSGDVFQAVVNKRVRPVVSQDDHAAAIAELVNTMEAGRKAFLAAQAKQKVALPAGVKSTVPSKIVQATAKRDELKTKVSGLEQKLSALKTERTSLSTQ